MYCLVFVLQKEYAIIIGNVKMCFQELVCAPQAPVHKHMGSQHQPAHRQRGGKTCHAACECTCKTICHLYTTAAVATRVGSINVAEMEFCCCCFL